jgi:hypothetical protein
MRFRARVEMWFEVGDLDQAQAAVAALAADDLGPRITNVRFAY